MERENLIPECVQGTYWICEDNWSLYCSDKKLRVNNSGIKLYVSPKEKLSEIVFDKDSHIIRVIVDKPTLPSFVGRSADLSESKELFNDIMDNIVMILESGGLNDVKITIE